MGHMKIRIIPVVKPTDKERSIIKESKKEFRQGEYHTLDEFLSGMEDND
ncbi:hypothetical protein [Oceanobacillus bengalensis]|nr:hypothetical protein [Oceanobacillus bengalensis]